MSEAIVLRLEIAEVRIFFFLYSYIHTLDKLNMLVWNTMCSAVINIHLDVRTSSVVKTFKIAAQIHSKSYLVLRLNKQNTQENFFLHVYF